MSTKFTPFSSRLGINFLSTIEGFKWNWLHLNSWFSDSFNSWTVIGLVLTFFFLEFWTNRRTYASVLLIFGNVKQVSSNFWIIGLSSDLTCSSLVLASVVAASGFTALTSPTGTWSFAEMEAFSEVFISFETSAFFSWLLCSSAWQSGHFSSGNCGKDGPSSQSVSRDGSVPLVSCVSGVALKPYVTEVINYDSFLYLCYSCRYERLKLPWWVLIQDKTVEESTQKILLQSWMFANCSDVMQVSYIPVSFKQPMSSSLGIVFLFKGVTKDLIRTGTH